MKKYKILWGLPKCDAETQSEQILLEKWYQQRCRTQGCLKPSILKNTQHLWAPGSPSPYWPQGIETQREKEFMHQVHLAPEAEPSEPTCGSPPPAPEAVPAAPTLDISFAHLIVQFNQIPHILQSEHLTPLEKQDVLATWASSQVTSIGWN